jgi:signal transduction histidine kinase
MHGEDSNMIKIFLKLYALLAVALCIFIFSVLNLDFLIHNTMEDFLNELSQGTMGLIDKGLQKTPKNKWQDYIQSINAAGGYTMQLDEIEHYKLAENIKEKIKQTGFAYQRLNTAEFGYRKISNSKLVLKVSFGQSQHQHNSRLSKSTFELLEQALSVYPEDQWQTKIKTISQQFTFPVSVLPLGEITATENEISAMKNGDIMTLEINKKTETIFKRINQTDYLIRIGPFHEPFSLNYLNVFMLLTLALIIAIPIFLWVWPLWRDLLSLDSTAKQFGQGKFNTRSHIKNKSTVFPLSDTFNAMASRIQSLISSHKELTNAVSHELRTPIARLRFGMEILNQTTDKKNRQRHIEGMNKDIDELDELVAELLTYARFDREKPELVLESKSFQYWIKQVIKNNYIGQDSIAIHYMSSNIKDINVNLESRLLSRALTNILQNAKHYAKTEIQLSISYSQTEYEITIDDDGPGIKPDEREKVFKAFTRLDASRDKKTGGYGLGLAIVYRIIQWLDGEVCVSDSPLGGARFRFTLPR